MEEIDTLRQAVSSRRQELIALIQSLVRTPSLPGEERAVQELMAAQLRSLGLETMVQPVVFDRMRNHPAFGDDGFSPYERVNVIGRWHGTGGGRSLILNGHVDVVSPGDPARWHHSPWSGEQREGWLYGRGSCDMKSGLASALMAIRVLQDLGWRPAGDVIVESVVGEESGGCGTLMTIIDGIHADGVVILEPTAMALCPVQSGALTFRLTVAGRAAHGAMRQHGVSAIEKFALLHRGLLELERDRHAGYRSLLYPDPDQVAPISIGTIRGGDWHSTVPESVIAEGRFGVFPGETVGEAREALERRVAELSALDPWLAEHPPLVEWIEGQFESGETAMDQPVVSELATAHRQALNGEPAVRGVTYGSDLRLFTNHGAMPAVLYGPGDIALAHAVNECIQIDEVLEAVLVLTLFLRSWCGTSR